MTIEEKAKAYDKLFTKAKQIYNKENDVLIMHTIEDLFPELKESEEERVKRILHSISSKMSSHLRDIFTEEEFQCFDTWSNAWLEKQGEPNLVPKPAMEAAIKEENVGNPEPKFKVGDWIIENGVNKNPIQIASFEEDSGVGTKVWFNNGTGTYTDFLTGYHKWTIQDAKNGDVLVTTFEEDNMIVMYRSMCTIDTINVHCCLDNKFTCANLGVFDAEDVKPATKEQRDLLFLKIKEAGYEWDSEKKELKKFHIIDEGKAEMDYCFTKMMNGEKVSSTWSEEDEKRLKSCLNILQPKTLLGNVETINTKWLKSLKYRIQPIQEWSEEDEKMFKSLNKLLNEASCYSCTEGVDKILSWLKSLRPQNKWKPSDEQMEALANALSLAKNCGEENAFDLRTLYEQLKKLKGE